MAKSRGWWFWCLAKRGGSVTGIRGSSGNGVNLAESSDCTTLKVLDAAWVVHDMGDDLEGYRDVAGFFIDDVKAMRAQIMAAAAQPGVDLVPVIHEVANSMGVVGGWRGVCALRALERQLRAGETIAVPLVTETVLQHLDATVQALQAWLAGAPTT